MSIDVLGGSNRRTPGDIRKQVADIEREYAALIELSVGESVLSRIYCSVKDQKLWSLHLKSSETSEWVI